MCLPADTDLVAAGADYIEAVAVAVASAGSHSHVLVDGSAPHTKRLVPPHKKQWHYLEPEVVCTYYCTRVLVGLDDIRPLRTAGLVELLAVELAAAVPAVPVAVGPEPEREPVFASFPAPDTFA